jgi:hypothetical protein
MSHSAHAIPEEPKPIKLSMAPKVLAAVAVLAGIGAFFYAYSGGHRSLAWSAYLIGAFFALGLGLFGVLWNSIINLSHAVWSVSMRRVPEAMSTWLLPGGVLMMLVAFGAHELYHWTDAAAVAGDALLQHKEPFLNIHGFLIGVGASLAVWFIFAAVIVRNSRKQDETGKIAHTRQNVVLSALFVVIGALTLSVVSFYLLMSLEPHWFSTMYAVLIFTDVIQTGTAFVALVVSLLMVKGSFGPFVNENHLHSLTKMMFATTGFWAYIYFCQFLLIWYANIPEETIYFLSRYENGWLPYLLALPIFKFLIPFVILVPRDSKRKPGRVIPMAILILAAQFLELYMLVSPAIGHGAHKSHAHLPWVEFLVTAGFFGAFFLVFAWSLGRNKPVPLKDPRMRDCLEYHQ